MDKQQIRMNRQKMRKNLKKMMMSDSTKFQIDKRSKQITSSQRSNFSNGHTITPQNIRLHDQLMNLQTKYTRKQFADMFQQLQKIGQGCHSIVYKCRDIKTDKFFALKAFKTADQEMIRRFKAHFLINKDVYHKNLNNVYYLFIDQKQNKIRLVIQYCPYKDLRQYIDSHKKIQQSRISSIIHGILQGINYLHRHRICHRDIKPDNVLYNPQTGQLKIIDFEIAKMSKYIDEPLEMWTITGTLQYKAPEMYKGSYNELIDMWALGIIAYEMAFGRLPFDCEYVSDTIEAICEKEPEYDESKASPVLIDFIKRCLTKDPTKRIKSYEALRTPFFLSNKQNRSPQQFQKRKHNDSIHKQEHHIENEQNMLKVFQKKQLRRTYSTSELNNKKSNFFRDIEIQFLRQ